ncbi:Glycerol dehydrogenase [Monoraphidium neglectum]|uniref:Glycerol dehydrogenase n=1 Tax=Monoraphidium neglectum TaxID=145388 RepID=A0A0D2MCD9_9CHLO|nr:Glycerol dehydrogenase [Monoraphidium neglectum]KIY98491.1 Glycerol dehydrogenase [Monoraphidium neglectum]|eukprot:XP_013897511.1 Glycerol dehydrogenase [Monoraphidium neglectum]
MVLEGRPKEETDTVLTFCDKVGLPTTLREVGVDAGDLDAIMKVAERCVAKGETSHNEPFEVTARMVADAIAAADRLGALHKEKLWP